MLNFDGAVRSNNAAASYVIRDHDGLLLAARGKRLCQSSVLYAEMIGVWLGLRYLVTHMEARKVWIQGDSMVVLNWIQHLSKN